eukprot:Pgem_evm1s4503
MAADFRPEQICNLLSPSNFFTMLSSSKHLCQLFTIMSKQVTSRHINDFGPAIGTKEPICFVKNYGGGVNKCCEQCKCNEKTYLRLWNGKFGTVKPLIVIAVVNSKRLMVYVLGIENSVLCKTIQTQETKKIETKKYTKKIEEIHDAMCSVKKGTLTLNCYCHFKGINVMYFESDGHWEQNCFVIIC